MKILLQQISESEKTKKVKALYEIDRVKAGILVRNDIGSYFSTETSIIDWEDGNFNCYVKKVYFKMSINNVKYITVEITQNISIKKGKLWYINPMDKKKSIQPLTMGYISSNFLPFILEKYPMLRFLTEHVYLKNMSINTILTNKLFTPKKCYNFLYKTTGSISATLVEKLDIYSWKQALKNKVVENASNFNLELLVDNYLFLDTLRMANVLRKKVNCAWSVKRLKLEHDEWAKEITNILYTAMDEPLSIKETFVEFANTTPEVKLLKSTKELAIEGMTKGHCVASYSSKVNTWQSAIYNVGDYTLELSMKEQSLYIAQFRGRGNCLVDTNLNLQIQEKVDEFNKRQLGGENAHLHV